MPWSSSRSKTAFGISDGVFVTAVFVVFVVSVGGVAAQSVGQAPDCSTVSYDGAGTVASPYEISNVVDLQCMGNGSTDTGMNDSFVLVENVNASGTSDWNQGDGFEPVGECGRANEDRRCSRTVFNGTLDGDGYTVTGLTIDRPDENETALFGALGRGGTVENLGLEEVDVTGGDFDRAGGLVGVNIGTVNDTYATGEVTGENFNVGGLVGASGGEVKRSYADVYVEGVAAVGGLVGNTGGNATVSESYATGDVTAERRAGGLVGRNTVPVTDSYATGNATATEGQAGGLVGSNQRNGTVRRTYAVGKVEGQSPLGGVSGRLGAGGGQIGEELPQGENETSFITDSYWNTETTSRTEAVGERAPGNGTVEVENVTGLGTEEMQGESASENMESLGFGSKWQTTDGYPELSWQTADDSGDNGTTDEGDDGDGGTDTEGDTSNDGGDSPEGLPGFDVFAVLLAAAALIFVRR